MKRLCCVILLLLSSSPARAEGPTLKDARLRWLRGNYEEAQAAYEALAKDPTKDQVAATIGISRALQSQGEYDKASSVIEALVKDKPRNADLLARQAELLHLRGKWNEAEKAADAAIEIEKNHFLARWLQAQLYRDRGELKKADEAFRWFVRIYTERSNKDDDIKNPEELALVGLAGTENARWHNLSDQFDFILKEVYKDALKYDRDFWPVEYQAGMLLLEKYNRPEALAAFDNVLKLNPSAAEALVGKGMLALQKLELKDAEQFAERALKINANLPEALRLRADVHYQSGEIGKAVKELESARHIAPREAATLARLAACMLLQQKKAEFEKIVAEVEKFDSKPGVFYFELAERLEDRRWFDDAEKYFKKAAQLRPMLSGVQNSLGMLYMRLGKEKEARELLKKGFDADPFNVRVSNTLKVLNHLEKYETLKTDHFELRYDPKNDLALARYMGTTLEDLYEELAGKFQYRPKGPILIEVFNNHEMFSGRTIALPDLHTIGACTGKMVAMVSPHGRGVGKKFNWNRVIRHELVHIFNLEQTNYLVPHWVTEGLAVQNEGFARPPIWNRLLLERVPTGDLYTLETIDLGFMRPRSALDWNMAYCQSLLYIEFLQETYGPKCIGALLAAYRDGLDTAGAFQRACKADKPAIEKGYREFLDKVVAKLGGKAANKPMDLAELKEAVQNNPGDLDLKARLAERYLDTDRGEARRYAREVLDQKKTHPLASYVLARLATFAGDAEQAKLLLEAGLDRKNPEPKVVLMLGKMYYDASEFAKAAELFELGRQAEPHDPRWAVQLARAYAQTGDKKRQIAALKDLVATDADDLDHRKRLSRLLSETGDHAGAERYARQALEIDIRDKEARELLFKALGDQKKDAEIERLKKALE
jgi:tetratricopeptide (TPR) repeat protein